MSLQYVILKIVKSLNISETNKDLSSYKIPSSIKHKEMTKDDS